MVGAKGLFEKHKKVEVTYDTHPGPGDMVWIDQTSGVQYNFDDTRNLWVSSSKHEFEFARKGNADGMYLPLLGDLYETEDVYISGYPSIITSVWCRSKSGDDTKTFEIRKNGSAIFTFSYDGSKKRLYVNNNLNIPIESEDEINVYVTKEGGQIRNTVCRVETARRYDI